MKDTFTTPPDCKKLMVSARAGPLFTEDAAIEIGSDGWPSEVGDHTIGELDGISLASLYGLTYDFLNQHGSLQDCNMLK